MFQGFQSWDFESSASEVPLQTAQDGRLATILLRAIHSIVACNFHVYLKSFSYVMLYAGLGLSKLKSGGMSDAPCCVVLNLALKEKASDHVKMYEVADDILLAL